MAITLAQAVTGGTGDNASSVVKAYASNITSGNLLVVAFAKWTNVTSAPPAVGDISKSAGTATIGSWTLDNSLQYSISTQYWSVVVFSAPVTGTGSCTITITTGYANAYAIIGLMELAGADTSGTRQDGAGSTGSGTTGSETTGSFNTSMAGLIVGAVTDNAPSGTITQTQNSNYTVIFKEEDATNHLPGSLVYRITTGNLTGEVVNWTAPSTYGFVCCAAAYKQAAGGGGANWLKEDYWWNPPYQQ